MFEQVEFTNMCMICDKNKVVVIDRKKKDWPGITFPGGHVELGESFTDAVIRKVREETGLTISSPQLCGIKDWVENQCRYVVLFYKATRFECNLVSSSEGEVWWEDIDNLPNLYLSPDMNDGLGVHTVLLPAKLFFGDSLWSLERFYNAFVTSSLITLALFVENVVLAIIDVVKK